MTETRYYIISTAYVGPNLYENLDTDRIEIHTEPGIINTSHEIRTEGWLGQTNDWSQYAHGEYATIEDALDAVDHFWPEHREDEDEDRNIDHDDIVRTFRPGRYAPISYYDLDSDNFVTADSTDAEVTENAVLLEDLANETGCTYVGGIEGLVKLLMERRTELTAEAERDAEDSI